MICDLAITKKLTWSLITVSSIIFAWTVLAPGIVCKKHSLLAVLISLSLAVIPYLFIMEKCIETEGVIMAISIKVSVVGIAYLWCIYLLIFKTKLSKFTSSASSLLLAIPVSWVVNSIVDMEVTGQSITDLWDIMVGSMLLVIAAVLFGAGYKKKKSLW